MIKLIDLSRNTSKGVRSIEATFMEDGNLIPLRVTQEDKPEIYQEISKLLEQSDLDVSLITQDLYNLMSPVRKVQQTISSSYYLSNNLSVEDGILRFGEHYLEETLSAHMLSLLNESNVPKDEKLWKSYVRFLDNMFQNVNAEIRNQLFRWMDYENKAGNGFAITEDGCIVGYKGCKGSILEPYSSFTGNAIVDGVEISGHIPNKVGSVIQMPRSEVQFDPSVGCSFGLHVGTRDYAVGWAPILLLVKVNPRDVVSVPYECDSQKMRVCEYTVLKVTDASEEHKMFHADEDDYDEEYYIGDDCFEECCEECCDDYDECNDCCEDCEEMDVEITLENIEDFLGTFLYVSYEDKEFVGTVIDIYEDGNNSGIILKDDNGEYKHIKLYRINSVAILGLDETVENDEAYFVIDNNKNVFDEEQPKGCEDFIDKIVNIIEAIIDDEDFPTPF